jgi:hypothetical protein
MDAICCNSARQLPCAFLSFRGFKILRKCQLGYCQSSSATAIASFSRDAASAVITRARPRLLEANKVDEANALFKRVNSLEELFGKDGLQAAVALVWGKPAGAGEAYESDIKSRCTSMLQIPYCRSLPWPRECS